MTRAVLQTAVATIRGKNGRPFAGGRHRGIMHPYILSDLANDLTANGVLDTEKFTREGQKWIEAGLAEDNEIIPVAGIDFVMSTNVPLVANLPASGKSSYATYISADEMMFSVALGGFEDVPSLHIGHEKSRCIGEHPTPAGQSRGNPPLREVRRDYTRDLALAA